MSLPVSIQYCAATRRFSSNSKIVAHIPMGRMPRSPKWNAKYPTIYKTHASYTDVIVTITNLKSSQNLCLLNITHGRRKYEFFLQ